MRVGLLEQLPDLQGSNQYDREMEPDGSSMEGVVVPVPACRDAPR
jgi:hypothetical protein